MTSCCGGSARVRLPSGSPAHCGSLCAWILGSSRCGGRPGVCSGLGLCAPPPWRSAVETPLFRILSGHPLLRTGMVGSVCPLRLLAKEEEGGAGAWLLCKNMAAGVRESGGKEEGALHLGFLPKVRGRGRAGVGGGLVPRRTASLRRSPRTYGASG
jgi:hypothetical protein